MTTFVFFYFMNETRKDDIREAAAEHAAYWQKLNLPDYRGGPFSDFSGGLITFQAEDQAEADRIVAADPFVQKGLLEQAWTKGWGT
jgi:uncharacterized protein YciI